jgi:uncharacterized membrane protein YkoI
MPQSTIRKATIGVAAFAALALGGSAISNAASTNSATTTTPAATGSTQQAPPSGTRPDPTRPGGHVGANGKAEQALSASDAAKVKAAALAKVAGGTVERVETDVDHGSPFEAHVTKADGTEVEVLIDAGFNVTAVNEMGGHR